MAVNDIKSNLLQTNVLNQSITTNTTTNGAILDTAAYELGLMFSVLGQAYTDGTYTLLLEESDDSGMAGAAVIPSEKLIGILPELSVANIEGDNLLTVGVFSNLRYVRASIVSTGVTTGGSIVVTATQKAENKPV